jgi:hypothetical protein
VPEIILNTWAKIMLPWALTETFLLVAYHRNYCILPIGKAR